MNERLHVWGEKKKKKSQLQTKYSAFFKDFDVNIVPSTWHQPGPDTNLWCNIVWCSTKCGGSGLSKHIFFAHAKVRYLYVSILVQHHIVQLQISEERHRRSYKKTKESTISAIVRSVRWNRRLQLCCSNSLSIETADTNTKWLGALTCR